MSLPTRAPVGPSRIPLVCLGLLLLACISSGQLVQLSGLSTQPDFDEKRLRAGGVAVFGFEGEVEGVDAVTRDKLEYPLFAALHTWHPELPLTGAKTVRATLEQHGANTNVQAMLATDRISELPFSLLRQAARGRRLLVSAQLKSNEVIQTSASSDDEYEYCTTRAIAVRYRVLDLAAQRSLWQGVIRQSDQDCSTNPRSNGAAKASGVGGFFAAMLSDALSDAATSAVFGTYPQPPSLFAVAAAAATDFASVLPGAAEPKTSSSRPHPAARGAR
jgi:hypothetical protein